MREREKRKEKVKIKKRKEKEKKEGEMKEFGGLFLSSLEFRRSELIGPRCKVQKLDKGLLLKR